MATRICLYGPTGSGKSTLAQYLVRAYDAELIKIAEPLYKMQASFYATLEKEVKGQDGELLQFLAYKIEKEQPQWLSQQFLRSLQQSRRQLIVNDDCRLNAYAALKSNGFVFIHVHASSEAISQRLRLDHTAIDPNHSVEQGFDNFQPHYTIENSGLLEDSLQQLDKIMEALLGGGYGWLTGRKIWDEVLARRIVIDPFDSGCLNPNSYNYHLAPTLKRITSAIIDCRVPDEFEVIEIPETGYILQPNECYLGATNEVFGSDIYASLITGRSSVGRKFLTNHVTAGLIDQGFLGNITLEIVAQKPTRVYPGMQFGQIFWFTTFGTPYLYNGKYQKQIGPTLSRLEKDIHEVSGDGHAIWKIQ